jgi:hypothetical protein
MKIKLSFLVVISEQAYKYIKNNINNIYENWLLVKEIIGHKN